MRGRVAVVGSGVSGLTAAYLLRDMYEVTLFEADDRYGGHAHTHSVDGQRIDSGFIVHNERTYPNLLRIFKELNIKTQETEMSMSINCKGCGLQYAGGRGAKGILAKPIKLLDLRFLKLLIDVPKFYKSARNLLESDTNSEMTWGEFLAKNKFNKYFINKYLSNYRFIDLWFISGLYNWWCFTLNILYFTFYIYSLIIFIKFQVLFKFTKFIWSHKNMVCIIKFFQFH